MKFLKVLFVFGIFKVTSTLVVMVMQRTIIDRGNSVSISMSITGGIGVSLISIQAFTT